jgi:hypothetical protein
MRLIIFLMIRLVFLVTGRLGDLRRMHGFVPELFR